MLVRRYRLVFLAFWLLPIGCGRLEERGLTGHSDLDRVRQADISILFIGNSHTSLHGLPDLVVRMIQSRHPEKKVYSHTITVSFLEDATRTPDCGEEIASRSWTHVVLQGQKISMSGRFEYSRQAGIDLAKLAKARGAAVFFFAEWGRKGVADDGPQTEKIYREMAATAGVTVARVGRAWDLALAEQPELPLHDFDGNHESALGTFLTACVLCGKLTGESPADRVLFAPSEIDERDRKFLAGMAAKALLTD